MFLFISGQRLGNCVTSLLNKKCKDVMYLSYSMIDIPIISDIFVL